jgi:3-oxoacyl-[acyl-carrier protein] reductase
VIPESAWGQHGAVAVITGATGYLGRALARGFAEAGATVVLTARCEAALGRLADDLAACGAPIHTVAADLTDPAAGERIVEVALTRTGRIDALVLNAGALTDGLVAALDSDALEQVHALNVQGAFRLLRAALRPMILARRGTVIVVSSSAARRPGVGQAAYASSKAALEALVRVAARETAGRGIRVNGVAPGLLDGGMAARIIDEARDRATAAIPMGRLGRAEDVVPTALFLASPMSSYVTGQIWGVDGGWTA